MKFVELTVHTTTEASEIVADVMWNYTSYGVSISDIADVIALQKNKDGLYWDYMDDDLAESAGAQSGDVLVKCCVAADVAEETCREILRDIRDAKERSGGEIPFGRWKTSNGKWTGTNGGTCGKRISGPFRSAVSSSYPNGSIIRPLRTNGWCCSIPIWPSARGSTRRRPCVWS